MLTPPIALQGRARRRCAEPLAERSASPEGALRRGSGACLEAPAVVAGLDDFAVMGEPVEESGGHLGIAEDARPLAEGKVGGDDDRGAFIEAADQVEQQLAAGLGERQIAELVEDDEVDAGEVVGDAALAAGAGLGLELVDEV